MITMASPLHVVPMPAWASIEVTKCLAFASLLVASEHVRRLVQIGLIYWRTRSSKEDMTEKNTELTEVNYVVKRWQFFAAVLVVLGAATALASWQIEVN